MKVSRYNNTPNKCVIHKSQYCGIVRQNNNETMIHRVETESINERVNLVIQKDTKVLDRSRNQILETTRAKHLK